MQPSFRRRILREKVRIFYTDKKENKIFLTYKEIQNGAVENSYMRKGFLYEEMRKYQCTCACLWVGMSQADTYREQKYVLSLAISYNVQDLTV